MSDVAGDAGYRRRRRPRPANQREAKGEWGRTVAGPVDNHRRVDDRVLDVQVEVQQTISGV